jgi:hypothetical protein
VKLAYLAYACVPATVLAVEGLLSFVGCSSSGSGGDSGACEPACIDANEALPPVDVREDVADAGPETGASCTTVCAKTVPLHKLCPDPGCASSCARMEEECTSPEGIAAYQRLLECELKSPFECSSGVPSLPVATDCVAEVEQATRACTVPDGGVDASCAVAGSSSACTSCCAGKHATGVDSYNVALKHCACDFPALCGAQCTNTECSDVVPPAGSACAKCLAEVVAPDGGCALQLSTACGSCSDCVAYEDCLTSSGCARLK